LEGKGLASSVSVFLIMSVGLFCQVFGSDYFPPSEEVLWVNFPFAA